MNRFLTTLSAVLTSLLCPIAAQAQAPSGQSQGEQSTVLQIPVQATMQVDPGYAEDNRKTGDVFYETAPFFAGHFVGGAGAYIIKPFFQSNPAFFTKVTQYTVWPPPGSPYMGIMSTDIPTSITRQEHDFCWDLNAAPLVWLGYVTDNGLGVRVRWWQFDQDVRTCVVNDGSTTITSAAPRGIDIMSEPMPPIFPLISGAPIYQDPGVVGDKMVLASSLKLDVWDFEATQEAEAGRWWFLFSGGFRYAHIAQNFDASLISSNPIPGNELLRSGHNFNGAGPTLALEARRPIGTTRFAVFANVRGSFLFGEASQRVYLLGTQQGWWWSAPSTLTTAAKWNHDTFIPVGEMELGAEYSRTWGWIRPFLRTGLVAQSWFGAGSASSDSGNLGFLGLEVSAGLNY